MGALRQIVAPSKPSMVRLVAVVWNNGWPYLYSMRMPDPLKMIASAGLSLLGVMAVRADTITLTMARGPSPGETVLSWMGGTSPYQVHRFGSSQGVVSPSHVIALASASPLSSTGDPASGQGFYFVVVSGVCGDAVTDVGESCDDGGTAPGDGCSATCQIERPLTLSVTGSGTGSVTVDGSPVCQTTCPETTYHANGSNVLLQASTQNGASSYFGGWSGECSGIQRTCVVSMTQARSVTAIFLPITQNLAFVSSSAYAPNLGSAPAYDSACNGLASVAGINDAAGTAYIAWTSDSFSSARNRLGAAARGWITLEGKPFADDQATFLNGASPKVWNALRVSESGVDVGAQPVMTGTAIDGTPASSCSNYAGTGSMTIGYSSFGGGAWTNTETLPTCATSHRIYCLMRTKNLAVSVAPVPAKRVFLSTPFLPDSTMTPDQRCNADKPPGMGMVRALVAAIGVSASSYLNPSQTYSRLDGVMIGTGAEISAGGTLRSGMWQFGSTLYLTTRGLSWTGAASVSTVGSGASTCSNWTSVSGSGIAGSAASTDPTWWNTVSASCNTSRPLHCVEQ